MLNSKIIQRITRLKSNDALHSSGIGKIQAEAQTSHTASFTERRKLEGERKTVGSYSAAMIAQRVNMVPKAATFSPNFGSSNGALPVNTARNVAGRTAGDAMGPSRALGSAASNRLRRQDANKSLNSPAQIRPSFSPDIRPSITQTPPARPIPRQNFGR